MKTKTLLRRLLRPFSRDEQEQVGGNGRRKTLSLDARLTGRVERDVELIRDAFGGSSDLVVRTFQSARGEPAAVLFLNGMVSTPSIAQYIIAPVMSDESGDNPVIAETATISALKDAVSGLNYGHCVLLREGRPAMTCDVKNWAKRAVPTADIEPSETGPMESFIEDLATNVVLLRRRLRTEKLQVEKFIIGQESRTDVRIVYLRHIVRNELVAEVRRRLQTLEIDAPVSTFLVQELTTDTPWSPFPNALITGRPDRTAAMLLEGHVAILIDGTPMVMIVPGTLVSMLQAADDYHSNFYAASFTRLIRWTATLIGLLASPIYVAVISYHHELIPTRLLFTIAAGREGVPFPPIVEAFLMEMAFELLREAGLRVPRQIGQAVSIVGVLIIGDAAVRAGLISPFMIVVVGISAISSFAIPSPPLADAVRLLRFPLIVLGGALGLFTIIIGLMFILTLLVSARSYGVPFFTPFIPMVPRELEDALVRAPAWRQLYRPWQLVQPGKVRQQPPGQKLQPNSSGEDPDGT